MRWVEARKIELLDPANPFIFSRMPPGNRLETIFGNRKGQHSTRIDEQFRICFVRTDEGPTEVATMDYQPFPVWELLSHG